jgi:hypothetical protein
MRAKKTLKIDDLKRLANDVMRESPNHMATHREAVHCFVSNLLMQANAYKGFNYLVEEQMPPGLTHGIDFDESPSRDHKYPDPTRMFFY